MIGSEVTRTLQTMIGWCLDKSKELQWMTVKYIGKVMIKLLME